MNVIESQVIDVLEAGLFALSDIKPSDWNEDHRVITTSESPFPGKFSYDRTPYLREIIDCMHVGHPSHTIAVKKGAQIGFSTGVIEGGVGWIISESPGNILFLTGHSDLSEEAIERIDHMIDGTGIRPLIRSSVLRAKNKRTGDTNKSKEYPGGKLVSGSAGNHKLLRQRSVRYGFIDDFDAAVRSTKKSGNTRRMIEQRFAAYSEQMKLFYISTPELLQSSNIEPVYLLGDQRKFHIPCPCCGVLIVLEWSIENEHKKKEKGGIVWELDNDNRLIPDSVGYVCQECGGFFDDSNKHDLLLSGEWKPTAVPSRVGYYSYHISSLYAPPGMYDWEHYVDQYLEANPPGGDVIEEYEKTFQNLVLGEPYVATADAPKANDLQKKIRSYEIGIIPEALSIDDGNGKIVLLTCACDLNGIEEDARLDYEVLAWSETGSSYSITQGSIGTFIPREGSKKKKVDRERWTYEHHRSNSVWPEFEKILNTVFVSDTDRKLKIGFAGVDCGHYTAFAYTYIDNTNCPVVGLKGKDADKYIRFGVDVASFRPAKERSELYLVEVGMLKDQLSQKIKLKYNEAVESVQPPEYMNFPSPADGKYSFKNYFAHYESEHRVVESKDGEPVSSLWKKKGNAPNHFWDVRVYNMVLRDIIVSIVCKEMKLKNYGWNDYVDLVLGRFKRES